MVKPASRRGTGNHAVALAGRPSTRSRRENRRGRPWQVEGEGSGRRGHEGNDALGRPSEAANDVGFGCRQPSDRCGSRWPRHCSQQADQQERARARHGRQARNGTERGRSTRPRSRPDTARLTPSDIASNVSPKVIAPIEEPTQRVRLAAAFANVQPATPAAVGPTDQARALRSSQPAMAPSPSRVSRRYVSDSTAGAAEARYRRSYPGETRVRPRWPARGPDQRTRQGAIAGLNVIAIPLVRRYAPRLVCRASDAHHSPTKAHPSAKRPTMPGHSGVRRERSASPTPRLRYNPASRAN